MKKIIIWLVVVFAAIVMLPTSQAWECEYGEVNAWVKLQGDTEWREATVEGVTLKVHEPFKVKLEVTTKVKVHVGLTLYDPGITKVYEVIEGPSKNDEVIDNYNCPVGWTKTYEWTVRPTGEFKEGTAPWNVFVQFTKTMSDYDTIDKTILHAYISPSEWQGSDGGDEGNGDDGSSISSTKDSLSMIGIGVVIAIIIAILIAIVWKFKFKK